MTIKNALEQVRLTLAAGAERNQRRIAGAILGSLPKKPKRTWTGWIKGEHFWRWRKVVLPDGRVGSVYGSVRSRVIVRVEEPFAVEGFTDRVYDAAALRVYKLPAAVILGRAKRGVKERPSALKAATSRLNGCAPVRLGSRPRGRPLKIQSAIHPDLDFAVSGHGQKARPT